MRPKSSTPNLMLVVCTGLAVFSMSALWAQQSEPKYPAAPTGSVIGNVIADETRSPVRFAEIRLVPKHTDVDRIHIQEEANASNPPKPLLRMASGTSIMDGSFRIDGIPVGDYYAGAVMPGYLTPGTSIATETATAEQLKDLLDSMPTVHVTAGQVASVSLTLHRGAVIAGRLQFADGSPAVGAKVGWELAERDIEIQSVRMTRLSPAQEILSTFGYHPRQDNGIETDDEGRYRIYGLPAGKYIVSTVIISPLSSGQVTMNDGTSTRASGQVRMYPNMTAVYAPGVFRRKDAKVFEVREGEQRMDADMKLDPSGVYTVRGRILAGEDHHVPNQAMLRLREDGKDIAGFAMIDDDGSFQIGYLPPGSYTLIVAAAGDITTSVDPQRIPLTYQTVELPFVVIGQDVVIDDVLLTPLKPGEKMKWPQ